MATVTLKVTGMKCGGCESNVNNKLKALDGVSASSADSKNQKVTVEYDSAKADVKKIGAAISEAGYTVVE